MKRFLPIAIFAFLFSIVSTAIGCAEVPKPSINNKETQVPSLKGRAVSLNVLQSRLKEAEKKGATPKELLHLAGLKRITGYVVDRPNRDLILVGLLDNSLPSLYTEDFVVALRNAVRKYAERRGNTIIYSHPGCSIDPDPKTMKRLDAARRQIFSLSSYEKIEKELQKWHKICRSPQHVRVLGIPFNTRFAWAMVKADYDMKRLVDGFDTLKISGFSSLPDMTLDLVKRDVIQGRPVSVSLSSLNRFWFYPGENRYLEDKGVVTIERCQVLLLTEAEYSARGGRIVGSGRADPLAHRFCEIFTAKYADVARQRSIYAELENLFRFVALAKILKFKSAPNEAGIDLNYLLERFQVAQTPVSQQLPGRSNVKEFKHRQDVPGGYRIAQLWIPTCGGVGININVSRNNFMTATTGDLAELSALIMNTRPSPDALFWDFSRPPKRVKYERDKGSSHAFVFKRPGNKDYPNI
jgi:hypothetical protein